MRTRNGPLTLPVGGTDVAVAAESPAVGAAGPDALIVEGTFLGAAVLRTTGRLPRFLLAVFFLVAVFLLAVLGMSDPHME
jgi:hypothetical protein